MYSSKPSSPKMSFLPSIKDPLNKTVDLPNHDEQQLHRLPTLSEALEEIKAVGKISGPTAISSLLLYSRAMISMLFLGYLGELELAGGSLAIGVANITGYSVISGLAMGMEPICGQAYGAKQLKLLGITLQRTVLLLLSASIPISFMWACMKAILLWCGQDQEISSVAHTFIVFSIPDLFFLSLLHPLRVYLRAQSITLPVTYCSAISVLLHVPLNFLLVVHLKLGVAGVAIAMVWTNLNVFLLLSSFVYFSGVYENSWVTPSTDCLRGWSSLLALALPTCASVCLEWWCSGLLLPFSFKHWSIHKSYELGTNRPGKARISMIVSLFCALAIGLSAMLFTTLMRHQWCKFFTSDAEILELTAAALPIVGLCELGNCPQTTGCGVLRGTAQPTIGANINLGSFYLEGMTVAILMGFVVKMGFPGLWLGLLAAQATCALLMLLVLYRTDWMVQEERAKMLTQTSSYSNKLQSPLPISRKQDPKENNNKKAHLEGIVSINDEI
ncbi:hypothetical protein F3Y22_tig00109999pilonHSYRG00057 [Hibiscus syriacus]|uniref:Protein DETOXIFICATION n=1 Tax=Hibiscus syriacus TaxID=106335 RepID=A0A6A3BQK8_HIBSY|nr:hypothetical protein F3Y22_tig00109999pilonHSYRG00057 [Hibiscus syriacus]